VGRGDRGGNVEERVGDMFGVVSANMFGVVSARQMTACGSGFAEAEGRKEDGFFRGDECAFVQLLRCCVEACWHASEFVRLESSPLRS